MKLYEAGAHTKIFVGSDDEKAVAKAALQAIPEAVHITWINHLKKNINHYLMRKEGCNDKERKFINSLLFENSGVVFNQSDVEFKRRWKIFLKKVKPLQKFHVYSLNRLESLIKNSIVNLT